MEYRTTAATVVDVGFWNRLITLAWNRIFCIVVWITAIARFYFFLPPTLLSLLLTIFHNQTLTFFDLVIYLFIVSKGKQNIKPTTNHLISPLPANDDKIINNRNNSIKNLQ